MISRVRRICRDVCLLGLGLLVVIGGATAPAYRAAVQRGREALPDSALVAAPWGAVEYAVRGSGPGALVVHGAGGGYDQGLLIAETFIGSGYRVVAPSRFGYVRSSIPPVGTPEAQADAYALVLDTLGIDNVAVVAFSDGGPSALQFALRYPHRTSALVMMSAKSRTPPSTSPLQEAVFEGVFRSDYVYWAVSTATRPLLLEALGVPAAVQGDTTTRSQQLILAVTDGMTPISLRRQGIYHDRATLATVPDDRFPLERISAPTLVVHAEDDGLQAIEQGRHTAARVPGAELVAYERGGHLLSPHLDDVQHRVRAFLARHSAGTESRSR